MDWFNLSEWGNWASIVGTFISVVGLGFTFYEAKSAKESADDAANNAKEAADAAKKSIQVKQDLAAINDLIKEGNDVRNIFGIRKSRSTESVGQIGVSLEDDKEKLNAFCGKIKTQMSLFPNGDYIRSVESALNLIESQQAYYEIGNTNFNSAVSMIWDKVCTIIGVLDKVLRDATYNQK